MEHISICQILRITYRFCANNDIPLSLLALSFAMAMATAAPPATLPDPAPAATTVVSVAHDGKLAAKSQLSDPFKSRLSNVEKLLCDDSQLWFWLRLLEWKLVTTPLDELLLVHEFRR